MLAITSGLSGQQLETWTTDADGVVLGSGADELFESIRFGRFLPDGNVVIADGKALFLRIYDVRGRRVAEFGRNGAGPGEFLAIDGVWVTPSERIAVWDSQLSRFTVFDLDGSLVSTYRTRTEKDPSRAGAEPLLGTYRNGSVLLASMRAGRRPRSGEATPERWLLGVFSPEAELLATAGEIDGMWRTANGPLPFTPVPQSAVVRDSLWMSTGFHAAIEIRDIRGDVARTVELPWTVAPAGDPREALEAKLRQANRSLFVNLLEQSKDITGYPHVAGLLADDAAQVWVKQYDPYIDALWLKPNARMTAPGGKWWIMRSDGTWLATLTMPGGLAPLEIRDGRVLGVERDALDIERAVIRSIRR